MAIPLKALPDTLQTILNQRQLYRLQGNFDAADRLRQQLFNEGYDVTDQPNGTFIVNQKENLDSIPSTPTLTLFGSGEISSVGRTVHDFALKLLKKTSVNIALITTPAGFQPNVNVVYGEIAAFFQESLADYHPQIQIIKANTKDDANNPRIVEPVNSADYLFTGPGSPTYAVKHLRGTLLLNTILNRVKAKKASLSLASAATIAFSDYALPVYEIYKVGEPLHWQSGLKGLRKLYQPLTIIPHLNNQEGGTKTDTSYCYLGHSRYRQLLSLLPPHQTLWGIDEHTGVIINLQTHALQVIGKGKLHHLTP